MSFFVGAGANCLGLATSLVIFFGDYSSAGGQGYCIGFFFLSRDCQAAKGNLWPKISFVGGGYDDGGDFGGGGDGDGDGDGDG